MQTAPGRVANKRPGDTRPSQTRRGRGRARPLRPITFIIGGIITVLAIGAMVFILAGYGFGYWPPKKSGESLIVPPTPTRIGDTNLSTDASGLKVEVVGQLQKQNDQVIVHVRVTNQVKVAVAATASAPASAPQPAKVLNGSVKVFFYGDTGNDLVGTGIGNVVNLDYGASKEIDVVATGIGDFKTVKAVPDTVWTDKDPIKAPESPAHP